MRKFSLIIFLFLFVLISQVFAQGYDYLVRKAENLLRDQKYEEALQVYEQAWQSGEYHYFDYYNAACASALLDKPDDAFGYLGKAVNAGLIDSKIMRTDEDFNSLHADSRWMNILDSMDNKLKAIEESFPDAHPEDVVIDLPAPVLKGEISVEEAMQNRRSIRNYQEVPLTLQEIAQILWAGYGLSRKIENSPAFLRGGLRTAPSAGALYPLDLYVAAWNVTDLPAGIYYYKSETHQLVRIKEGNTRQELSDAAFNQPHFKTAAAAIVYSAIFERNTRKYGERGRERYVCMDLGHSGQNIYLQAYALKIGTCAIGAFTDLAVKMVVGMTKPEEPLYIMPLGKVE